VFAPSALLVRKALASAALTKRRPRHHVGPPCLVQDLAHVDNGRGADESRSETGKESTRVHLVQEPRLAVRRRIYQDSKSGPLAGHYTGTSPTALRLLQATLL
jgi:hypothetical protein